MKRARKRTKNVLDILHFATSVGWLGVGLCQLTLNVVALATGNPDLRHAAHQITHIFDRWVLIALAFGALTTGVLLGLKTKWGLLTYWWVATKLTLTLALLVFTPIWMGGWIVEAIQLSSDAASVVDPAYLSVRNDLLAGSVSTVTTLGLTLVLSVVKPWGRTAWGRRREGARLRT